MLDKRVDDVCLGQRDGSFAVGFDNAFVVGEGGSGNGDGRVGGAVRVDVQAVVAGAGVVAAERAFTEVLRAAPARSQPRPRAGTRKAAGSRRRYRQVDRDHQGERPGGRGLWAMVRNSGQAALR